MPAQSRRTASRPSRAQRRTGATSTRTYTVPEPRTPSYVPRRSYATEPAPVDYSAEYKYIRKDLIRILVWSAVLILVIIALSFFF
jgi:hypothetical protein